MKKNLFVTAVAVVTFGIIGSSQVHAGLNFSEKTEANKIWNGISGRVVLKIRAVLEKYSEADVLEWVRNVKKSSEDDIAEALAIQPQKYNFEQSRQSFAANKGDGCTAVKGFILPKLNLPSNLNPNQAVVLGSAQAAAKAQLEDQSAATVEVKQQAVVDAAQNINPKELDALIKTQEKQLKQEEQEIAKIAPVVASGTSVFRRYLKAAAAIAILGTAIVLMKMAEARNQEQNQ